MSTTNNPTRVLSLDEYVGDPIAKKTAEHPCFKAGCSNKNARIHMAVAPACNISCNYCVRKYDCVNEGRPGVTSIVLKPEEALTRFKVSREAVEKLTVVGIAGPGDALANWKKTSETFRLIRAEDPEITSCLSTNGLLLPRFADEIVELGVSHVTVTVNAVDPAIGAQIYKYISFEGTKYEGIEAGRILFENQEAGIKRLVEHGICVKVNTILIKGVNEDHVEEVAQWARELGAGFQNITKMIPVEGSVFEKLQPVSDKTQQQVRKAAGQHIDQIYHCHQCRADAVGVLGQDLSSFIDQVEAEMNEREQQKTMVPQAASSTTYPVRVAVASRSGKIVDEHFGHAKQFFIFESNGISTTFIEQRSTDTYCYGPDGCGDNHATLTGIIDTISDCQAAVILRIGTPPRRELEARGIRVFNIGGEITSAVAEAAARVAADHSIEDKTEIVRTSTRS